MNLIANFTDYLNTPLNIQFHTDLFHLFQTTLQNLFDVNRKNLIDDFYAQKILWERLLYEGKTSFENFAHEFVSALKVSLAEQTEKLIDDKIAIKAAAIIQCEKIYSKQGEIEEGIIKELEGICKAFDWIWPEERNERFQVTLKEYNEIQVEIEELESAADKAEYEAFVLENTLEEKGNLWAKDVQVLSHYCEFLDRAYRNMGIIEKNAVHQEHEKLKALSQTSSKALKKLQKNLKTVENISMLMKVCRKYETIEDRIKFFDQPVEHSESSNNLKSFNRKLSQKSLNFSFRSSSIFTDSTISKFGANNSAYINKCNTINNQSCLKTSLDYKNEQIDAVKGTSNAKNSSQSNPFSFLHIFSSQDFNPHYPTDNASKFTDEDVLSAKYPSEASTYPFDVNELVIDEFYRRFSIVKTDCLVLKNYKEEMTKTNENLRKLLAAKKHEFGVMQNMKKLRLNASPSVGFISQFSHQMPQIQEEILIRKCRSMHLKVDRPNKTARQM